MSDDISMTTVGEINILAEPITALITSPFVMFGANVWGAAWLVYPLVSYFLKKKMFGEKLKSPGGMPKPDRSGDRPGSRIRIPFRRPVQTRFSCPVFS